MQTINPLRQAAWRVATLMALGALLTGCYDTKQEITLNPDGTGKVVIESVFTQSPQFLNDGSGPSPVEGLTNYIRKTLEAAGGVNAWRDISFHQRDDGRAFFRGTAFFTDLAKLKLDPMIAQRYSVTRDDVGNLIITLAPSTPSQSPIQKTNEPVTAESLARNRATLRSAMPLLKTTLGTMKGDTTIHVPGTIKRCSNFETNAPNMLHQVFDGATYLQALENFLFDTNYDEAHIIGEQTNFGDLLNEKVYGQRGPMIAVVKPGSTPLFDYEKEVATARADFSAANYFGLAKVIPTLVLPASNGAPAKVNVVGIEWKRETDSNPGGLHPRQSAYFEMKVQAELPGEIFSASKVSLDRAITHEGVQLSDISRPHHPLVLPGRTNVSFIIRMTPPPAESEGFAEVTGSIECIGPETMRTVELVSGKLRGGAQGKEHGARIEDVIPNFAGGDKLLFRTTLKPEQLRFPRVVGDNGITADLQTRKHESFGDEHVYTLANRDGIPRSGKLIAQVLEGDQVLRIPFSLTNVNLLGQPR